LQGLPHVLWWIQNDAVQSGVSACNLFVYTHIHIGSSSLIISMITPNEVVRIGDLFKFY